MSQESSEKDIIEKLHKITLPMPDPEFEQALRSKFLATARRKRRSIRIMNRLTWVGSVAIAAFIGVLLYQNVWLQHDNVKFNADKNDDMAGILSVEDQFGSTSMAKIIELKDGTAAQGKTYLLISEKVKIADSELTQINNYGGTGPIGDWRFYHSPDYNQIYISKDQVDAQLLYQVDAGYVTPHIYSYPLAENEYLLVMIEGVPNNNPVYHYFNMDANGTLTEIAGIPESGYDHTNITWSPNGENAILQMDNLTTRTTSIGLITQNLSYQQVYGEVQNIEFVSGTGMPFVSLVNWLNDNEVLVYINDEASFVSIDLSSGATASFHASMLEDEMPARSLYSVGMNGLSVLKTGPMVVDVGFYDGFMLFLVDSKNKEVLPLEPSKQYRPYKYAQELLGIRYDGNLIISDIVPAKDNKSTVAFRVYDPVKKEVIWERAVEYDQEISNPYAVFSEDNRKLAVQLYGISFEENEEGLLTYAGSKNHILVMDLERQAIIFTEEVEEYNILFWQNNNTLQYGEQQFHVK